MAEVVLHSSFAKAIFLAVRVFRLRNVLEIGSYDGDGSTQVLIAAMRRLDPKRLVCLEMREDRHANLRKNTAAFPWVEPVCASTISWTSFSNRDFEMDVLPHLGELPEAAIVRRKSFWESDVRLIREAPAGYLEATREAFDGVLIDGGAYSAFDEFRLLRDRCRCFMLDDVFRGFKNKKVFDTLVTDRAWFAFHVDTLNRNGTAIFCRKDSLLPSKQHRFAYFRALLEYQFALLRARLQTSQN